METLLLNRFFSRDYELPANVPVVRFKAGTSTYTMAVVKDKPTTPIEIVYEASTSSRGPAATPNSSNGNPKQEKRKRSEVDRGLLVRDACVDEDLVPPPHLRKPLQ
ncbi:hypothetical protein GN958_ATG07562 [Phytophthora infestans]|uniref:Uncharacterized protein n=1 Tax=Phytophthora infestans TaxID=4787 RepID=A0A8S9UQZ1_PHYIN|nr:hypothetical protein GN958_ATG07562 [Phytophthora infestans]